MRVVLPDLTFRSDAPVAADRILLTQLLKDRGDVTATLAGEAATHLRRVGSVPASPAAAVTAAFESHALGTGPEAGRAYVRERTGHETDAETRQRLTDALRMILALGRFVADDATVRFAAACREAGDGSDEQLVSLIHALAGKTPEQLETDGLDRERVLRGGGPDVAEDRHRLYDRLAAATGGRTKGRVKKFRYEHVRAAAVFEGTPRGAFGLTGRRVRHTMPRPASVMLTRAELLAAAVCGLHRAGCGPAVPDADRGAVICHLGSHVAEPTGSCVTGAEASVRDLLNGPDWLSAATAEGLSAV